jgi:two-component system response regulator FixJ
MRDRGSPHQNIVHLIEDDAFVRNSIAVLLSASDIEVRGYASGTAFLAAVNPDDIRCILIDVNMPGINGIDLLDRLRGAGVTAPAIFITADGDTAELRAAMARTGAHLLLKPFMPGELVSRVTDATT